MCWGNQMHDMSFTVVLGVYHTPQPALMFQILSMPMDWHSLLAGDSCGSNPCYAPKHPLAERMLSSALCEYDNEMTVLLAAVNQDRSMCMEL
jgi:hypothetical protein